MAATKMSHHQQPITRRTANFKPTIWSYDYIQSLSSEFAGENYANRVQELKEEVRATLVKVADPLYQMELIDTLQRIGLSYHFDHEIKSILGRIYDKRCSNINTQKEESLYDVALEFRLLRQHGADISQEIFNSFMGEKGNFIMSCLSDDCKGILALYEAAYYCVEGESIFHNAINFTTEYLKEYVKHSKDDEYLSTLANHALELPLHWRMPRLEARWFIDVYEKHHQDKNPVLLELAKLDFNVVQATHQEDLKHTSMWWRKTGLGEKLNFARDRLMEIFSWAMVLIFEPQFGYCRRMHTKIGALITTIDDVYDVYGTLDELELFTDAVERWDITAMERLPYYMKICYLALYNTINEMAFVCLKDQGHDIIKYLRREDEMKRGDIPKSIQCYMHETGVSEKEAREHIRGLINVTWLKMNKDIIGNHHFSSTFVGVAMNLARVGQCTYQFGDGFGVPDKDTKHLVLSLIVNPIP